MSLEVSVRIARNAMATRFEIWLQGGDAASLRGAGEEALDEIERLDAQLSLYNPSSELSRVNSRAWQQPVRVEPALFHLLQQAKTLSEETQGAFDISIAPLMDCWGFMREKGNMPDERQIQSALNCTGMKQVILDEGNGTVRFEKQGMRLDLGAIGKGYAVERAADILREAGIESALLHGGASTVYALGSPMNEPAWRVAVEKPDAARKHAQLSPHSVSDLINNPDDLLAVIPLRNESLSVSAVWGRSFESNGRLLGHVMDPRSGHPVSNAMMAAVAMPSATESDALSTALLVLGKEGATTMPRLRHGMRWLLAGGSGETVWVEGNIPRASSWLRCPQGLPAEIHDA
jgi:thiamine biosynthesis lipoprotein